MATSTAPTLRRERRVAQRAARRAARSSRRGRTAGSGRLFSIGRISVVALIVGAGWIAAMLLTSGRAATPTAELVRATAPGAIRSHGTVLGRADAPVTIDIYEDFQCPACRAWGENVFPTLVRNELAEGQARLAFHSYAFLGRESTIAAQAAWAADRQSRFWDMWATLYANQGLEENGGAFSRDRLLAMADLIGLDRARFAGDLDSEAAASAVSAASAAAVEAGVTGTPTIAIGGVILAGNGYDALSAAIADAGR